MTRRQCRAILALATLSIPTTAARANDLTWSTPTSGRWLDPTLWSTGTLPTTADTATINATGTYAVTLDGSTSVGPFTLNSSAATLAITSVPIHFSGSAFSVSAGTFAIHAIHTGTTQINVTSFTNAGTVTFDADADASSSSQIFADVNTASGAVQNSGLIEVSPSPSGPPTLPFHYSPTYSFTGIKNATFTNTGTLRANVGSALHLNNYTLNQNAGLLDRGVSLYAGTLNYNGGACSPDIPTYIDNSSLKIAAAATAGNFILADASTVTSNIPAGNTVSTYGTAPITYTGASSPFTNAGHLIVGAYPFPSPTPSTPSFTLSSTSALLNTGTIDLNSPNLPASNFSGSITNQGAINVNAPNNTYSNVPTKITGSFTQNAGSLTIDPTTSLAFTNAHFYYNAGSINGNVSLNNSTLHLAPGLTNAGGTFLMSTSSSAIIPFVGDIPAGVTVAPTASIPSAFALNLAPFTNAGTLATLVTNIGKIYFRVPPTGALTNTGTITGTLDGADRGASLRIAGALTNTGAVKAYNLSAGTFNQNAGTLDVDTTCVALNGTFNYNGGTITGKPVLINNATLNIAPNTNPASFTFQDGTCALHGSPAPGSALALDSLSQFPATIAVTADPFTNAGTLSLTTTTYSAASTLTLPTGTLTNTGTLSVTKGQGGTRTINANIANSGTLTIGANTTLTYTGSLTTSTPLDLQGTLLLTPTSSLTFTAPNSPDTVRTLLAAAHITSTATDATHRLGYAPTPDGSLRLILSLAGDANLNGQLDPDDYALLDRSFAQSPTSAHWYEGDFNYDGLVNDQDYLLLDTTYLSTHPASPAFLSMRESQFGASYVTTLLATLPDPALPLSSILYPLSSLLFRPRRRA